ncbi:MAG: chemotaxis protein CheW [Phycisphaerae bacterium]|nr:chemotaxis protein CheW [Phycisphaerae bacterium]
MSADRISSISQGGHVSLGEDAATTSERLRSLLARPIPPEELDENTRSVAAPAGRRQRFARPILVVQLGPELLGLDVGLARRVVRVAKTHRIPHRTHDAFGGIANVGGELVLVARLDRLLGLDHAGDESARRMVVLGDERRPWVVVVDRVEGVRRFDAEQFLTAPATVARALDGMTEALAPLDDNAFVSILDSSRLARGLERCLS